MKIKEQIITSRTNPLVLDCVKLSKKRERDESGRFLCDGKKLCFEYIKKCGAPVHLFVNERYQQTLIAQLEELERECSISLELTLVGEHAFLKMTEQSSPDGIILIGDKYRLPHETVDSVVASRYDGERLIILCSLRDTGNVGTVIRTALALGYDRVIMSSDCADVYNPKTLRAAMGAAFAMKITVCKDLAGAVIDLVESGRRVFAAELRENALSLDKIPLCGSDIFIIGNEGHGIPADISAVCTSSVYIPISESSESLNAAVAAAVLMWQQRSEAF